MKKKLLTAIFTLMLIICVSSLSACGIFGGGNNGSGNYNPEQAYALEQGGEYYIFTGATGNAKTVEIKSTYQNLPVKEIKEKAFENNKYLENVIVPNSIENIGDMAFAGCSSLKYNAFDNGLYVGNSDNPYMVLVKAKATDVTKCAVNENTKFIHSGAFALCGNLKSVTIPESVKDIASSAFAQCGSLAEITLPSGLKAINKYTFWNCVKLSSVNIPDGVESIDNQAFKNCVKLTKINLPSGLKTLGEEVFFDCGAQIVWGAQPVIKTLGNNSFKSYKGSNFTIPSSVESLGAYAFKGCNNLVSISIPDSVQEIGEGAFEDCKILENVSLPTGLTEIANRTFYNCSKLKYIVFPTTIATVGNEAFYSCSKLESVFFLGERNSSDRIPVGSDNDYLKASTTYIFSENQPTEEGNYWHYVSGVPTAWGII